MKRARFIILIMALFIMFEGVSMSAWDGAVTGTLEKVIQSSQGPLTVKARYELTEAVAKETASKMMTTGGKVWAGRLVGAAVPVLGAGFLVWDMYNMYNTWAADPTISVPERQIPGQDVIISVNGVEMYILQFSQEIGGDGTTVKPSLLLKFNSSGYIYDYTWGSNVTQDYGPRYRLAVVQKSNSYVVTYSVTVKNPYDLTYTNQGTGAITFTGRQPAYIDHDALWADISAKKQQFATALAAANLAIQQNTPKDNQENEQLLEDMEVSTSVQTGTTTDPATGAEVDPDTGEELEPVTETTAGASVMNIPGQPAKPTVDTTIEPPEESDIGGLITGWLANAPFMNIINNFEVEASGGACQFYVDLPFGDGSAEMDFCQFSDLWAALAAVIIAISYIYGAMIIFGGKS